MRLLDWTDFYFLTLVTLIQILRWTRSRWLCDVVGNTIALVASNVPGKKHRCTINKLKYCIGDRYTPPQLKKIMRNTYRAFWQDAFALASPDLPAASWKGRVSVQGMDHLQQA